MNEVVKMITEKTGLSEDMAEVAVDLVIDYLKDKLPDPIAGQLDTVMSGGELGGSAADLAKGLGGLLGKD